MGTPAPSISVISGNLGQNMNMSEMLSIILEPVANEWKGGLEVDITGEITCRLNDLNEGKTSPRMENVYRDSDIKNDRTRTDNTKPLMRCPGGETDSPSGRMEKDSPESESEKGWINSKCSSK